MKICESNLPTDSNYLLVRENQKVKCTIPNFMHLKKKLIAQNFDTRNIAKIMQNLAEIIGWEWYDQSASIEVNYAEHDGKKFAMKVRFIGAGKLVDLNYETALANKITNLPSENNFIVIKGFISKNLDSMILNASEVPVILRKNILKFAQAAKLNSCAGEKFSCVYSAKDLKVVAIMLENADRKRAAIEYKSSFGRRMFSQDGVSLVGERIVFLKPVNCGRISSIFGYRMHPVLKIYRFHYGVDYAAPRGTKIYAPANGVVIFAGTLGGYGNCVKIKHDNNITTLYGHMQKIPAHIYVGKKVFARDHIGYIGTTGLSSGPHLHYEIWVGSKKVDPLKFCQQTHRGLQGKELEEFKAYAKKLLRHMS